MKLITLGLVTLLLALASAFTGPARADDARLAALPAPALASPSNGTVLPNMGFIVLNWVLPPGTTQYQIQLIPAGNDGPGINLIRDASTTYTVEPPVLGTGPYVLLPGMSYTWRVRATDVGTSVGENDPNWGAWSESWKFRTPPPSSSSIRAVSPGAGATVATLTPQVTWADSAAGLFYYEIQLTKDAQFRTTPETAVAAVYHNLVHGGLTNPVNSWAVPAGAPLEPATTYFWRVRPRVQGDGTPIGWSDHFSFTTAGGSVSPTPAPTFVASPTATPGAGTPTATPVPGTPTATPALPTCNWTGTWSSNASGTFGFQQSGSQAAGVFNTDPLTITSLTGNSIGGSRATASGWSSFTLFAATDCNSDTGNLTVPKGGINFEFVPVAGTRTSNTPPPIPTPAPASPTPTPVPCNWTGTWEIKAIADQAFVKRLALTHTGTAVTGTIDGAGSITGTSAGNLVSGTWSSAGASGTFSYKPFFGCGSFIGDWDESTPTAIKRTVFGSKLP